MLEVNTGRGQGNRSLVQTASIRKDCLSTFASQLLALEQLCHLVCIDLEASVGLLLPSKYLAQPFRLVTKQSEAIVTADED